MSVCIPFFVSNITKEALVKFGQTLDIDRIFDVVPEFISLLFPEFISLLFPVDSIPGLRVTLTSFFA
ncbi:hypothetical protein RJT34_33361 [Clitoria ternatea]|uniref:Uncharacterized protein n=1 Tax=Clitoria ternatea TaxID=43366 RepID=A0AAN9F087_CLITE